MEERHIYNVYVYLCSAQQACRSVCATNSTWPLLSKTSRLPRSVCMYVCMCVCIYVYAVYMLHVCLSICTCSRTHTHTCIHVYVCACVCTCAYACVCLCAHAHVSIYTFTHTHSGCGMSYGFRRQQNPRTRSSLKILFIHRQLPGIYISIWKCCIWVSTNSKPPQEPV
jgi:hypothetical protein